MRAVLDQFAALDQRMDRRVSLELGDDLLGTPAGGGEVGQGQHNPDRDRVKVGVDEPAAGDAAGTAEDLDVDALAVTDPEPGVDLAPGQGEDLLRT